MDKVVLKSIEKHYGKVIAVKDFNLTIADQEFIVFVGPSGCGKSTTLRMIAGLEDITRGDIFIDGALMNTVSPKDRDIAMVFQNYALYPHMTVCENLAFCLKLRKVPKDEISKKVMATAQLLGISELLKRKPAELSGGQKQRVAMGRAIIRNPKVFLFDEPLSNLDAKLRVQMRTEIAKLHRRLKATTIYVTHDQIEALTLADRIVIMNDGVIQQVGAPLEVYNRPQNIFVASFIGSPSMNFARGQIQKEGEQLIFAGEDFQCRFDSGELSAYLSREVLLGIRPQDLSRRGKDPLKNSIRAKIEVIEPMGSEVYIYFTIQGSQWVARLEPQSDLFVGAEIDLGFEPSRIHLFDPENNLRIEHPIRH